MLHIRQVREKEIGWRRFPGKAGQRNAKIPLRSASFIGKHHRKRASQNEREGSGSCPCHPLHLSIRLRTISLLNASGVSIALGCEKYNIFFPWWETLAKVCREITSRFNQGLLRGSMSPGPRQRSKGDREGERQTTVTFNY